MATPAQRTNTWTLDEWYDQSVAGTTGGYTGEGNLYSWGNNQNGKLGLNDLVYRSSPTQIPGSWGMTAKIAFTVGSYGNTTMAVKTDGTLWGWGNNPSGAMMNNQAGNPTRKSSPVQIPGTTYMDVASSGAATAVIKTDGTLWTAGHDANGNLGHNSQTQRSSPTQIPGTSWTDVTGGGATFMALQGKTLYSWGENNKGQLGHNNKTQRSSPLQIPGTTWTGNISVQTNRTVAIKTDGTLWSWGDNDQGALGHNNAGEPNSYSSPKQVGTDTTWNQIGGHLQNVENAGSNFLATKTDGTLWSWGAQGDFGTLGLNQGPGGPSAGNRSSPTQVGTDTNWSLTKDPYCDNFGASAFKTDGTMWVWGGNDEGRLGFNTPSNTRYSSPTQLPGTWMSGFVSYGGGCFAIKPG